MYIPPWPSLNPADFIRSETNETPPYPLNLSKTTYFYVARNGIYHLFRALGFAKGDTVLVPDYHHGNEIFAIQAAGAALRYYPVRKDLNVDLDAVVGLCEQKPRALYVTHFIGWPQPMNELKALCRDKGIMLIEDCALSLLSDFEGQPLGSFGDYAVFCLYKTLPVPNGGVLVQNGRADGPLFGLQLHFCNNLSVWAREVELMLQWFRSRYDRCGRVLFSMKRMAGETLKARRVHRVPVGDTGFNLSAVNVAMSPICHSLLRRFRYPQIKEIRRRNFQLLADRLRGRVSFLDRNLPDGACPLFFPLFVRDKHTAARLLWERGVNVVEFWNHGDPAARRPGSDADFLRRHLLEVPIHQDVTVRQLDYIADQTVKLKLGL